VTTDKLHTGYRISDVRSVYLAFPFNSSPYNSYVLCSIKFVALSVTHIEGDDSRFLTFHIGRSEDVKRADVYRPSVHQASTRDSVVLVVCGIVQGDIEDIKHLTHSADLFFDSMLHVVPQNSSLN